MPVHKLIVTAALVAANMALTMTRKIEGQRLDDLKFTGGDYGAPMPNVHGLRRIPLQIFFAEDLTERKQTRKTKGGKFNDYTYYGTFALLLAGHEISGVRRVWFDKHLVLDLSGAGPITPFQFVTSEGGGKGGGAAGAGGYSFDDHLAIYLGTETQEADPRMMAWVEARHGAGSCPAYRGTAYLMVKDLPLEKFGNRIPQADGEVASVVSPHYPHETRAATFTPSTNLIGWTFSTDFSRLLLGDGSVDQFMIWDVAARAEIIAAPAPVALAQQGTFGMRADGRFYAVGAPFTGGGFQKIYLVDADLAAADMLVDVPSGPYVQSEVRCRTDANGTEHWLTIPFSTFTRFYVDGVDGRMLDSTGIDWAPSDWFADLEGSIWAVGRLNTSGTTQAFFYRRVAAPGASGPDFLTVTGLSAASVNFGRCNAVCASDGMFVLCWDHSTMYRIDPADGAVLANTSISGAYGTTTGQSFANLRAGAQTVWLDSVGLTEAREFSLLDLSVLRTVDYTDWVSTGVAGALYDPVNHALLSAGSGATLDWRYLDRIGSDGVTLGDIAADICDRAGVLDYDFSDLDQVVPGWSWTQGQASNVLEPLFDLFDAVLRPHGFVLQGIKKSGIATGAAIPTSRMVVTEGEPRYKVKLRQAAELPRVLNLNFADVDADQQPNAARAPRPLAATGAVGEQSLDLTTLALDTDTAQGLTARWHRRKWNERAELQAALTPQELALEPGDCRTLVLDGEISTWRNTAITLQKNGTLRGEWVADHPGLALTDGSAGATFDGRDETGVVVPLLSKGFVLDIPLLSDLDEGANPPVYLLAAPYAPGAWPGASLYQEVGGEYSNEVASVSSAEMATWGYTADALPDRNPNLWDRLSVIEVTLQTGTLTGCSEADLDASAARNLALIGDEIVQFTTATLVADRTYELSGFKRGRKGTEWACASHASREVFVLLDQAEAAPVELSAVGTDLSFKAVTAGRTETGAFPIALAPFTGAALKPYAPCHLTALQDAGTGDWSLSWIRRTRIGGAWTGGGTIPLGEASEEYEVEILNGSTVVRTFTGLGSPAATYTAAMQATDFGGTQTSLDWRVYQISASVGRGFAAAA